MLKVQTANSTYIHCGVGGPLLKVGVSTPLTDALTPWAHFGMRWVEGERRLVDWGDPDMFTDRPHAGERWEVRGEDGMKLSTSPVVTITDYDSWCRRWDQPVYYLCTEHIFALAKHNDVRLCTSFHTEGYCDLCEEALLAAERALT